MSDRAEGAGRHATVMDAGDQRRWGRMSVIGGTLMWLAMTLGFLINTPTLIGPDETTQLDRVIAAAHGDLIADAGTLHRSLGVRNSAATYVHGLMRRNGPSWADFQPVARTERPSLQDLGGNTRPAGESLNYLTQHPPLYYDLMGAVMWLLPDADGMAADTLAWLLRAVNVLLVLPLPLIFYAAARAIFGLSAITLAAPFLPALVPGMARIAATINNDNLCILLGALILWQCIRVLRGNIDQRTALLISGLAVAASLTKGTLLILLVCIPAAYAVRAIQDRKLPGLRVVGILLVGAALAAIWWVRNLIRFGAIVPEQQAYGAARYINLLGGLRDPSDPADVARFLEVTLNQVPLRFWGSLGLHEPPRLPAWSIWTLTGVLLAAFVGALVSQPGRRAALALPWIFGFLLIGTMFYKSWSMYSTYAAMTGIQGRYMYPGALGLLLPIAVALCAVLRARSRFAPLVLVVAATVVTGFSLWISVGYTWLPRGQTLGFGNLYAAGRTLAGHFPFTWPVLALLITIFAAALIAAWACAVRLALTKGLTGDQPDSPTELTAPVGAPVPS